MDYQIAIRDVNPEPLASIRGVSPIAQLPEVMGRYFGRILEVLSAERVWPSGGAVAIYHGWTESDVDVEVGFTVAERFSAPEGQVEPAVAASALPGGRVAFTTHVGPYTQIAAAYGAIQTYANESGLKLAETMWERYLTGPEEPDLSKHVTEVFWPLASRDADQTASES